MDYLTRLKQQNITFNRINESEALRILREEFTFDQLIALSSIFDKYQGREEFVSLDFSQLYAAAIIDSKFSQLLMYVCLDLQKTIEAQLCYDIEKKGNKNDFLYEYLKKDSLLRDLICSQTEQNMLYDEPYYTSLSFQEVLNMSSWGTIEKMIFFFYYEYTCEENPEKPKYLSQLFSIRRIRNIVAHNNGILSRLKIQSEYKNLKMNAFLGKNGLKKKTLQTNMSKAIVSDIVDVLFLYYSFVPNNHEFLLMWRFFDEQYCQKYSDLFRDNYQLRSIYTFIKKIIDIFEKSV